MSLPNYFLADLPPEASLSPAMITEACQTLRRNRAQFLQDRATETLIRTLADAAHNWLQPDYHLRKLALEQGPEALSFSRETLSRGLDTFFRQLTGENLQALVVQEFGHHHRLDRAVSTLEERQCRRAAWARGPELLVHFAAGNLPVPALMSIVSGLLVRSAQFVKCATGTTFLPRLFAHSLYELEPKLGACLEIVEWPGGSPALEEALLAEAECVTATGSNETLASIRQRLPKHARFLGYGHRLSFGLITRRSLDREDAAEIVADAAADIIAWNQLGCLSPHVIYVEQGQSLAGERFAADLAEELARREHLEPRGPIPMDAAAAIHTRRSFYEVRAAHSPDTKHWFSPQHTGWSVIYEADPLFQKSCLNRFIYVKGVSDLAEALNGAESVRDYISTVGLAAAEDQLKPLAHQLARWGALRICPLGQMQNPPLGWRHDGRPVLAELVTWTDWEY